MPDTTQKSQPVEHATLAWTELAERADALIEAWHGDELPPTLADFLPAEPQLLRRLVFCELVKIDLEYRWRHHELPKEVEEYLSEFPDLFDDDELPCDLIYEEYHVRQQTESAPAPEQYFQRFPKQAE